jgi:hypothetical protein
MVTPACPTGRSELPLACHRISELATRLSRCICEASLALTPRVYRKRPGTSVNLTRRGSSWMAPQAWAD